MYEEIVPAKSCKSAWETFQTTMYIRYSLARTSRCFCQNISKVLLDPYLHCTREVPILRQRFTTEEMIQPVSRVLLRITFPMFIVLRHLVLRQVGHKKEQLLQEFHTR